MVGQGTRDPYDLACGAGDDLQVHTVLAGVEGPVGGQQLDGLRHVPPGSRSAEPRILWSSRNVSHALAQVDEDQHGLLPGFSLRQHNRSWTGGGGSRRTGRSAWDETTAARHCGEYQKPWLDEEIVLIASLTRGLATPNPVRRTWSAHRPDKPEIRMKGYRCGESAYRDAAPFLVRSARMPNRQLSCPRGTRPWPQRG